MKELDSFTVERLEELARAKMISGHDIADIRALARIALDVKKAEPVTWWTGPEPTLTGETESFHDHETGSHYLPLVVSLSAYNTRPQLNSPEIPKDWPTEDMVITPKNWKLVPSCLTPEMKLQMHTLCNADCPECGKEFAVDVTNNIEQSWADILAAVPEPETHEC
ncbi:hypothetical protein [Yersinia kristensenii]|uniref:hypothetical protein n=1 Tax=Yersinia kristensenii TaxID=28152 RepID=UPI0001A5429D|nr:hypothetical protein [Yersinia kristensenii]EEP89025.1 hypothetical protein ykris0001_2550 [Yersinia kristensenii ATCC 33638]PEH52794.1 hypothetical protein CRM81_05190 [Yersinia kristensenii]SUP70652.1 Uncharacterised protein [Yersinia kristensenii]SUQ39277.1 Uncharacterised protein [Yersinia kristensenii]